MAGLQKKKDNKIVWPSRKRFPLFAINNDQLILILTINIIVFFIFH